MLEGGVVSQVLGHPRYSFKVNLKTARCFFSLARDKTKKPCNIDVIGPQPAYNNIRENFLSV